LFPDTDRCQEALEVSMLRLMSFALAVIAAVVLLLGIAVRISSREFVMGMAPVTLWRFSVACIGFAIYLHLYAKDER
jgi:hypothetical protein